MLEPSHERHFDSSVDLKKARILVTGGTAFWAGKWSKRQPRAPTAPTPRSSEYDLRDRDAIRAACTTYAPTSSSIWRPLSAASAPTAPTPAAFFYENAIMGIELMEQSRVYGVAKFVQIGTVPLVPKVHACAVPRRRHLGRLPGGD